MSKHTLTHNKYADRFLVVLIFPFDIVNLHRRRIFFFEIFVVIGVMWIVMMSGLLTREYKSLGKCIAFTPVLN